jgi:hypothetical protein
MPFQCDVELRAAHLGPHVAAPARVQRWLATKGSLLDAGDPLVQVEMGGRVYVLAPTFHCMLVGGALERAELAEGDLLAQLAADGEEIPYGRPYCKAQLAGP